MAHSGREDSGKKVFGHRTPPGTTPGSLVPDPAAPHPEIRLMAWSDGDLVEKDPVPLEELEGYLGRWPIIWVNVDGLGDAGTLRKLGEIFGIHKLALEDVVHVHQRAKVEELPCLHHH